MVLVENLSGHKQVFTLELSLVDESVLRSVFLDQCLPEPRLE